MMDVISASCFYIANNITKSDTQWMAWLSQNFLPFHFTLASTVNVNKFKSNLKLFNPPCTLL